jgi:hypothetical protein
MSSHDQQTSSTVQNQLKSPLLRLPAELRNQIYTLACKDLVITAKHPAKLARHPVPPTTLSLLIICKQLRFEATPILFSHATVPIADVRSLARTPAHLGLETCRQLTSIELSATLFALTINMRLYPTAGTKFPNASKITVNISCPAWAEEPIEAEMRKWFGNERLEVKFKR